MLSYCTKRDIGDVHIFSLLLLLNCAVHSVCTKLVYIGIITCIGILWNIQNAKLVTKMYFECILTVGS
jgi:hypothetical protein